MISLLIALLLGYFFLYNIYGSEVRKSSANLFADPQSEMTIEVIPVNALGSKAFFRTSSAEFEVVEGNDLIEIKSENKQDGVLQIRSKGITGIVGIKIKSEHSLFPEYIEIEILSRSV